jgi:hypothetical protein
MSPETTQGAAHRNIIFLSFSAGSKQGAQSGACKAWYKNALQKITCSGKSLFYLHLPVLKLEN